MIDGYLSCVSVQVISIVLLASAGRKEHLFINANLLIVYQSHAYRVMV
jgi:hypothetical protein